MKFNLAIYSFIFPTSIIVMMQCKDEHVSTYNI